MDEAESKAVGAAFARRECLLEMRTAIRLYVERTGDRVGPREFESLAAYWSGLTSAADDVDPEGAVG